jgi:hypothetical protein
MTKETITIVDIGLFQTEAEDRANTRCLGSMLAKAEDYEQVKREAPEGKHLH